MSALASLVEDERESRKSVRTFFRDNARRMWGLPAEGDEPPPVNVNVVSHQHQLPPEVLEKRESANELKSDAPTSEHVPQATGVVAPAETSRLQRLWPLIAAAAVGGAVPGMGWLIQYLNQPTVIQQSEAFERSLLQAIEDEGGHIPPQ